MGGAGSPLSLVRDERIPSSRLEKSRVFTVGSTQVSQRRMKGDDSLITVSQMYCLRMVASTIQLHFPHVPCVAALRSSTFKKSTPSSSNTFQT